MMVTSAGNPSREAYAADVMDPMSIASLYNDPTTVLDIPRRAIKGAVYGTQLVGPNYKFDKHELVTITFEPEPKQRIVDLTLEVRPTKSLDSSQPAVSFEFVLVDTAGNSMTDKPELPAVLGFFSSMIDAGRDPFVSVQFDSSLRLAEIRQISKFIGMINTEHGIRVEPPATGQLYYEAFLPNRELLFPERRTSDPWEIHLSKGDAGKINAMLSLNKSSYVDGELKTKTTSFNVDTPEAIRRLLEEDATQRRAAQLRPSPPVLLVFADADFTYGQLLKYLLPQIGTHNVIHVFLETSK